MKKNKMLGIKNSSFLIKKKIKKQRKDHQQEEQDQNHYKQKIINQMKLIK